MVPRIPDMDVIRVMRFFCKVKEFSDENRPVKAFRLFRAFMEGLAGKISCQILFPVDKRIQKRLPLQGIPESNDHSTDTMNKRQKPGGDASPRRRARTSASGKKGSGTSYRRDEHRNKTTGKGTHYDKPQPAKDERSPGRGQEKPRVKKSGGPPEADPSPKLLRLNRYISNSGICSRREADDLITGGFVMVNGEKITQLGTKVSYKDQIKVKGNSSCRKEKSTYF
jgi:hypothetical protein